MRNRFGRLGFTLIELLIVITIIGILAVVFLPSIMDAPAKSREAARKANMASIVQEVEAGRLDNKKLTQTAIFQKTCLTTPLPAGGLGIDNFASYFAGSVVPKDPSGDETWTLDGGTCKGTYLFVVYPNTDKDKLYGVFSKVEKEANANVLCDKANTAVPGIGTFVGCGATGNCCYGVVSK